MYKSWVSILQAIFPYRFVLSVASAWFCLVFSVSAALAESRSLKLYYVHTGERAEIVFKKDGRYVQGGLKRLNYFLRDWRRNEAIKMDPLLFDLVWQIYQISGSRGYIHVVSAYRSPQTNNMLRARSAKSGVAKHSQHTLGKAMDFYLPDISLAHLRRIGLKQQSGGVGYYPASGSPFIHVDVGSVRHWPRMNRGELLTLFPDGRTMHIPSDGVPLAGYTQAVADYKARRGQPPQIMVAKADEPQKQGGVLTALFNRNRQEAAPAGKAVPEVAPPRPPVVAALPEENVPVPVIAPVRAPEQDEDEDNLLMAGLPGSGGSAPASIPVPGRKPVGGGMPQAGTMVVASIEPLPVRNVPVPVLRPRLPAADAVTGRDSRIAQPAGQGEVAAMAFAGEKPRQARPKKDAVRNLIEQAELIPLPEEDFMPDQEEAAPQLAARPAIAMVDNKTTSKTDRIVHRQAGRASAGAEESLTGQEKVAGQNGLAALAVVAQQLPKEVFVRGLQPGAGRQSGLHLSGTAINFRAVERISAMDEK